MTVNFANNEKKMNLNITTKTSLVMIRMLLKWTIDLLDQNYVVDQMFVFLKYKNINL